VGPPLLLVGQTPTNRFPWAPLLFGEKVVLKEFLESIHLVTVGALKGLVDLDILPEETPIALRCALKSAIEDLKTVGKS